MTSAMNRLFNLPESILSDIYTMDSTYRDKIRDEIKNEIINRSWTTFKHEFLSNPIFNNQPSVVKKLTLLLVYLQKHWYSLGLIPSTDIIILTNWKTMIYDNYHIDHRIDHIDYNYQNEDYEPLEFVVRIKGQRHTEIEGIIYTNEQYNNQISDTDDIEIEIDIHHNHEFKIVQCLR
jgi:hypothetical protein